MSELSNSQPEKAKSYHSDFIAGIFGGMYVHFLNIIRVILVSIIKRCAGVLAGHPFDTVKVRLQAEKSIYKGGWHTFTSIVREEKVGLSIVIIRSEAYTKV